MAKTNFPFSTGLGDISMYKQGGTDKIILRSKGGTSKQKIKTSGKFGRTRQLNSEFSAATRFASVIKCSFFGTRMISNYNILACLLKSHYTFRSMTW